MSRSDSGASSCGSTGTHFTRWRIEMLALHRQALAADPAQRRLACSSPCTAEKSARRRRTRFRRTGGCSRRQAERESAASSMAAKESCACPSLRRGPARSAGRISNTRFTPARCDVAAPKLTSGVALPLVRCAPHDRIKRCGSDVGFRRKGERTPSAMTCQPRAAASERFEQA